ncbi:MAG TPA: aldehyde dehydrogenase family protein [Polyangiaceae bacterium LLY-WYZ-15_(1-7)]|nr:aldehyde dehydrogenase family protein [Myxococcales bacterium]MAT26429.1 aldehyde dehydrogenase family protein [Sandaracinus sp.]HJL01535.1 aldehyde dehydrogenase family protein [Polyangiaceae bacterium LLY-WYZ-15_(1-7)]MBJ70459.1 aldehyde dehydrogenase family protein [Sandaracinus sp.]HJL13041.1 aldehyde dehydrogenase family protein [Polyangiaceae bacterium LLY-WYZ-15_(1-7)]
MHERDRIYVRGEWVASEGEGRFEVIDAATEEVLGHVPAGAPPDAERAVEAAAAAFPLWAATSVEDRASYLRRIGEALAERRNEIGDLVSREVGMPQKLARPIQGGMPAETFLYYARLIEELPLEEEHGTSLVVKEPVGVVAAITPWNYPLHQIAGKVAPALAAGCTVVLKPSEVAPLSAFVLADVIDGLGLPPGVFNLVSGDGPTVGEALVTHPKVDMVSFTGSTRAGRRVSALAAETIKRVTVELGGKSASVVLDDAELPKAVKASVNDCYLNGGQTCSAWTRLLVPKALEEEAARLAKEAAERFTVGDPSEPKTRLGPMVSATQRDRVRAYIRQGLEEGAELVTGGPDAPEGLGKGFFVKPTVFAKVRPEMTIAREEIFGPVLCILGYEDEEDAIRLANDSPYGLAGAVWSGDDARAERVARRIRAGQVDVNGGAFNPRAPFGGYKQSGNGREFGPWGLEEYFEIKSIQR